MNWLDKLANFDPTTEEVSVMKQQQIPKDQREEIEDLIPFLAKNGGIDLGHLSGERRNKLIANLRGIDKQPLSCSSGTAHGPG
ncbi:hypothetical protein H6G27_23165 [Nostoc linckia FACHB-104]|nr:hypothetical protein [Nostoc linckia FACHB-104]